MVRFVNFLFLLLLLGSAFYAYSVKYTTILFSTEVDKIRHDIEKEQIAISLLRAEWSHLTRPARLQVLGERHLDLRPLALSQIIRITDLPARPAPSHPLGAWEGAPSSAQSNAFTAPKDDKIPPLVRLQSFNNIPSALPPMKKTPVTPSPIKHKPPPAKPSLVPRSSDPALVPPAPIPSHQLNSR